MKEIYLTTIILLERMHREFMEVVKAELERLGIHDINNVQSLILHNIGVEEMTVGELTLRGYYLGSNVSYNVKKLTEKGYLRHERSPHDRRSIRVSLTDKGLDLRAKLDEMFARQLGAIDEIVGPESLAKPNGELRKLEKLWLQELGYGPRVAEPPHLAVA